MANSVTASNGAARAMAAVGKSNVVGECLKYVQGWLGIAPRAPTAIAAWIGAAHKHPGDANPPAGVPVFFAPNHVALSIGGGNIVSTDWPRAGHIGQTTIGTLSKAWSHPLLGWTEDLEGVQISGIGSASASNASFTALPASNPIADTIALAGILGFLTNSDNWLRIGYFAGGITLVGFALWKSSSAIRQLTTTTKKVATDAIQAKS